LPDDSASLGTLVVKSAGDGEQAFPRREESEAAVCDAEHPRFGFINATDYFFARRRRLIDGGLAKVEFIINRQGQEHVVHDHLSGVSDPGVFARGHHLFFVGVDESGPGLWSVDLSAATPRAERVAFDVASNEGIERLRPTGAIPLLRSSEWLGGVDHDDEPMFDSPDREALLVGIRESSLIPCDAFLCARWLVVDFEGAPTVVPLDSAWREGDLSWTPDGQGLLAVGEGVYWLTGDGYRDRYRLSEVNAGLFVPPRWPAR
jgi:hypothetical protein